MSFNFTVKEFLIGNGTGTPTLQFYKKGFEIGGGGTPSWQDVILSGNTALTLVNAKANGLNYLKLFGGTEQNGTPTPDTPVDIVSNNGALKLSPNLFDKSSMYIRGYIEITGVVQTGNGYVITMPCEPNTTYTFSRLQSSGRYRCGCSPNTTVTIGSTGITLISSQAVSANVVLDTVTTTADAKTLVIWFTNTSDDEELQSQLNQIQIQKGSVATPYHAYGAIYADGTVETVEVHGKNLWTGDFSQFDNIGGEGSLYAYFKLPKEDTYYTLSVTAKKDYTGTGNVALGFSGIGGVAASGIRWVIPTTGTILKGETKSFSNRTSNFLNFVSMHKSNSTTFDYISEYFDIQLEEGSTGTDYEPYYYGGSATAEMLLSVGDYKDVQSVLDGGITRNVGIKVLDGTELWSSNDVGTGGYIRFNYKWTVAPKKIGFDILANTFVTQPAVVGPDATSAVISGHGTNQNIYLAFPANLLDGDLTTSAGRRTAFNNWLAAQYANGTPVIIVYALETPTTESVTAQTLSTQAGTNIVEITQASIDGLPLEVSYKAGVAVTITEVQNAQLDNSVEVTING